jgi:hypothetical protein
MTRKKIIIKIALDLLVMIAVSTVAWLAVAFFQKKITLISQKIQEKKIISYNLNNRDLNAAKTREELSRLDQGWLTKVEAGLPYIDDTAPFIDSVDSLSRKYGLKSSLGMGAPEILPKTEGQLPVDRFAYQLSVTDGNLNTLINYLKDFEKLQFFAGLKTLDISADGESGLSGKIAATMNGNLYVREQD